MNLLQVTHAIIDSFTRAEKRYFPAYLSVMAGEDDKMLSILYSFLAKMPKATKSDLENEFNGEPFWAQPSVALTALIERKLLPFLTGPTVGRGHNEHEWIKIKELYARGIYDYALKKANQALAIAHRTHNHVEWLKLWDKKLRILEQQNEWNEYYRWSDSVSTLKKQKVDDLASHHTLSDMAMKAIPALKKHYHETSTFNLEIIAAMQRTIAAVQNPLTLSPRNKFHYHQLCYRVALAIGNEKEWFKHQKAIYEAISQSADLIQLNPEETAGVYFSYALILIDKGQYNKGLSILTSLDTLFTNPVKPLVALIFRLRFHGQLDFLIKSGKLQSIDVYLQKAEVEISKHSRHLAEEEWTRPYFLAGLGAWLAGDNQLALKWLNKFKGGVKSVPTPAVIIAIKTLQAFIHFQNGDQSMARSYAVAASHIAKTRKIEIGPFIHILNFIKNQDPILIMEGHFKAKVNDLKSKFETEAKIRKSMVLDNSVGITYIKKLLEN